MVTNSLDWGALRYSRGVDRHLVAASSKTNVLARIIGTRMRPTRVLVVGCGDGREAGILAREFSAETVGIDIGAEFAFNPAAAHPAQLLTMDAQALEFADSSFDLVYSFHALEHIASPGKALEEMRRVLVRGGAFLIGTPNKSRLIGYMGSPAPISERIRWNLIDIGARLRGRWSNEAGAHAGFTAKELVTMCRESFGEGEDISGEYYRGLYSRRERVVDLLDKLKIAKILFPCVYVAGHKIH
jgi:SAM-dependent methyltransferase